MVKYDAKALIKRARPAWARGKRRMVFREIVPTSVLQADLERIITKVVAAWWAGCRDQIMPAYRAALTQQRQPQPGVVLDDANNLSAEAESVARQVERLVLDLFPQLQSWTLRVEAWHREKWLANLTPVGVDLRTLLTAGDVQMTLDAVIQRNVSLIRSINSEARTRIEGIVFRGFTARTPARQIAKEISEAVGLSRARALRIAADQTNKLSSDLDTERMLQAGIDEWEWRHSGKVHYRKVHKARDGNVYTWANAPEDMPGQLPFCGCRKRAVINFD